MDIPFYSGEKTLVGNLHYALWPSPTSSVRTTVSIQQLDSQVQRDFGNKAAVLC